MNLTQREQEIISILSQGLSCKQIAEKIQNRYKTQMNRRLKITRGGPNNTYLKENDFEKIQQEFERLYHIFKRIKELYKKRKDIKIIKSKLKEEKDHKSLEYIDLFKEYLAFSPKEGVCIYLKESGYLKTFKFKKNRYSESTLLKRLRVPK